MKISPLEVDAQQLAGVTYPTTRLERLFANLPGGIVMLDEHESVCECNSAAKTLLGEPLLGIHWQEIVARFSAATDADDAGLVWCGQRLINVTTTILEDEPAKIILLVDVTENPAFQGQVNRQEALSTLSEMATKLAHQMRAPLVLSMLYVSHLAQTGLQRRDRLHFADKTTSGLQYLEKLIDDILTFDKGADYTNEEIPLSSLLEEFRQILAPELKAGNCDFTLIDRAPKAVLHGDRAALLRALGNIATNAMQACGPGGHLQLRAQAVGAASVHLLLSDTGPGIPKEAQARIVEPFFSSRPQNVGLGLSIAQAIVHAHEGVLWFESNAGEGTTVVLHMPAKLPTGGSVINFSQAARHAHTEEKEHKS
ncbi:MAG TPA: ATP-binding protein [Acidiferrobacterales bacterium]|nr:ATP-binding protein [Acidiferrobacterales bacterium]